MTSRDTDSVPDAELEAEPAADSDLVEISDAEPDAGTEAGPAGEDDADGADGTVGEASAQAEDGAAAPDGTGQDGAPTRRRRRRRRSFWRELPVLIAVALILAVVIKTYALQAFFIPSGSMENTLVVNDRVLINKLVYDFRGIHRGDIVVFDGSGSWDPGQVPGHPNFVSKFFSSFATMFGFGHPGDIYVKRVIGLPGDHIACCDAQGRVTVNGTPLNEQSYLFPGNVPSLIRFSIVVPAGRLWVMGDHREVSADSRSHLGYPGGGTIPENAVLGRAFVIIWPPSHWRFLPIPGIFEQPTLNKQQAAAGPGAWTRLGPAGIVSARLTPAGPALPLSLGLAGAVPLTWAQRRIRLRRGSRRSGIS